MSQAKVCKAKSFPFAMKSANDEELDRIEVLKNVPTSGWHSMTLWRLQGPGPGCRPVPLALARRPVCNLVSSGNNFTTLSLTQAYQQLELDPESRKYLVINTPCGLCECTWLPDGVASAPVYSKGFLESYIMKTSWWQEKLNNLDGVLWRLHEHDIHVNKSKCKFLADSVEYVGHQIDSESPRDTFQAILQASSPHNVQELQSFWA